MTESLLNTKFLLNYLLLIRLEISAMRRSPFPGLAKWMLIQVILLDPTRLRMLPIATCPFLPMVIWLDIPTL